MSNATSSILIFVFGTVTHPSKNKIQLRVGSALDLPQKIIGIVMARAQLVVRLKII